MDSIDYAVVVLFVLALFDWASVFILTGVIRAEKARGYEAASVKDRRRIAGAVAIAASIACVIGINRHIVILPPGAGFILFVILVLLPSLANLLFVLDVFRGRFGNGHS